MTIFISFAFKSQETTFGIGMIIFSMYFWFKTFIEFIEGRIEGPGYVNKKDISIATFYLTVLSGLAIGIVVLYGGIIIIIGAHA